MDISPTDSDPGSSWSPNCAEFPHSCSHCRVIVIPALRHFRQYSIFVPLPHTRADARKAIAEGCPLFRALFTPVFQAIRSKSYWSSVAKAVLNADWDAFTNFPPEDYDGSSSTTSFTSYGTTGSNTRTGTGGSSSTGEPAPVKRRSSAHRQRSIRLLRQLTTGGSLGLLIRKRPDSPLTLSPYYTKAWDHIRPPLVLNLNIVDREARFVPRQTGPIPVPSSSKCFELAREWLHECQHHHEFCQPDPSSFLPTRLLDVHSDPTGQTVRLIETTPGSRFVWCNLGWLSASIHSYPMTTTSSLPARCQGIPVGTLPALIQDGITLCRQLFIPYVWVNLLCVVSDDRAERSLTLAASPHLCLNAVLNIFVGQLAPARSFLHDPPPYLYNEMPPVKLRTEHPMDAQTVALVSESEPVDFYPLPTLYRDGVTFQYGTLSPRQLIFMTNRITWRCRTGHRNYQPSLIPGTVHFDDAISHHDFQHWTDDFLIGAPMLSLGRLQPWDNFVLAYSECKITSPEAKLTGIGELASVYARLTNKTYVAGLWKEDLPRALCWYAIPLGPQAQHLMPRPTVDRAPSWSWAAVDARVRPNTGMVYCPDHISATVEGIRCRPYYSGGERQQEDAAAGAGAGVMPQDSICLTAYMREVSLLYNDNVCQYDRITMDAWPDAVEPGWRPGARQSVRVWALVVGFFFRLPSPVACGLLVVEDGGNGPGGVTCYRRLGFFKEGSIRPRWLGREEGAAPKGFERRTVYLV